MPGRVGGCWPWLSRDFSRMSEMALTPLHVRDVCYGSWQNGSVCKYLDQLLRSDGRQYISVCTKLNAAAYAALQKKRVNNYHKNATADNCQGYLLLQYK